MKSERHFLTNSYFVVSEINMNGFELNVDTDDFVRSTAHQKEDLIDR